MIPGPRNRIVDSTLATERDGKRVAVGDPLEFPDDPHSTRALARRHVLNLAVEIVPGFARTLLEWRDARRWARHWRLDGGEAEAQFIEWAETVLSADFEREQTRKQWLASADARGALQLSALGTVYPPPELDENNLDWIAHVGPPLRASRGRRTAAMDRDIEAARIALERLTKSKSPKTPAGHAKRQARIDAAQAALDKAEKTARDAQSEPRFLPRDLAGRPLTVEAWRPDLKPARQYMDYIKEYVETVQRQAIAAGMKPGLSFSNPEHYEWLVKFQIEGQRVAEIAGEHQSQRSPVAGAPWQPGAVDAAHRAAKRSSVARAQRRNTILNGIKILAEAVGLKRRPDRITPKLR